MGVLKGVGIAIKGFGKALRGKGKVSPTIKSVKPNLTKTVKETKQDEYRKRYTALDKAEGKVKEGRKMMREGQKNESVWLIPEEHFNLKVEVDTLLNLEKTLK